MVLVLQAMVMKKQVSRFFVGNISDLPEGRESLEAAIQQVEGTERVLKSVWREHPRAQPDWLDRCPLLEGQSATVRRTAVSILSNLLA
jgi:hypothetical protein